MTIAEIKQQLTISQVLDHYGIKVNKNRHCLCPFHDDKNPSMQVYPETNTVHCFSGNCAQTGKAIDQIDFIMHHEKCTKHEAIKKAESLITGITPTQARKPIIQKENLSEIFPKLKQSLYSSSTARAYAESRNIYSAKLEAGYNPAGSGHHYKHLKNCMVFPLKDRRGKIVSLYGRSITSKGKESRHFYTINRKGLYPNYPAANTETLILTESIIDSATLQLYTSFTSLALYGTNGLTSEHTEAINQLQQLKEVILFLNGDEAGRKATTKYAAVLHKQLPEVTISMVNAPEGEDINSLIISHEPEILEHLVAESQILFASSEKKQRSLFRSIGGKEAEPRPDPVTRRLDTTNPDYLAWRKDNLLISILGGIGLYPLDRLKVTLKIERTDSRSPLHSIRHSLDLYYDDQSEKLVRKVAERLETGSREMQLAIAELTQELENYREEQVKAQTPKRPEKRILTAERERQAISFLKRKDLMKKTDQLIEQSGVVGEKVNRQILWYVYTTRLREQPLHVICLGASGTGKTYLQERVTDLIPEEDKVSGTAISENALYYAQDLKLPHKLFIIEDLDGASNVLYSLRELQTKSSISKIVTHKDSKGNMKTVVVEVHGPICLTGTTTKERLYEDNANRCLLIYLDGSKQQHAAIMDNQRKRSVGKINKKQVQDTREFLRDVQSVLKPITVRNPYAEQLHIPDTVFKPLRTNAHYLAFIEAITFYHQYQRSVRTDSQVRGRVYRDNFRRHSSSERVVKGCITSQE
ncbi:MAG: toprim domain-containing protein [Ekhidna sp.]|nr:toprim domain-containing protein [Ekhidna sp.]